MCDRAAAHGVTIAIQNHHDLGLHTEALLELLADIDRPNCKVGFDAWSPALRGESLYDAAKLAAPHTVITTNADYLRVPRHRYRPELVNITNRSCPTGCARCDSGPASSTMPSFSEVCATADSTAWRFMKCARPCVAAVRWRTSTPAQVHIWNGCVGAS